MAAFFLIGLGIGQKERKQKELFCTTYLEKLYIHSFISIKFVTLPMNCMGSGLAAGCAVQETY